MKAQALTLLLLSLAACGHTLPRPAADQLEWLQWKTKYGKVYADPSQEAKAHALWLRHRQLVQSHNSRADVTFTLELNAFADQEFRRGTYSPSSHSLRFVPEVMTEDLSPAPPKSFDWRTKGVVTPVRNQGQVGSAEAFAVTEDLESWHAIKTGQLTELSVTEVDDCCSAAPGMLVPNIYECIAQHGGLCSAASYPPHGGSHVCRNDSCQAVAKDAKVTVHVPKGDETQMVTAVLKCPLVVFIDASRPSFQLYQAGVYSDNGCSHTVDHALQLVGYGEVKGELYWILRNSWGPDWGMRGYIWMKRGVNMCGVADFAMYPQ